MTRKYFDERQTKKMQEEFATLRQQGLSKNKAIAKLAEKYFCHDSTMANYVKAWSNTPV